MRSKLVVSIVFAGALMLGVLCVTASGETFCPDAQYLCEHWPPLLGLECSISTAWCQGEDCVNGARGEEILVSSSVEKDDIVNRKEIYTNRWLLRSDGWMSNVSCYDLINHPKGAFAIIPETRHCIVSLETNNHYYLELIASNPVSGCHGWTECQCW